jgi:hypothetical protein
MNNSCYIADPADAWRKKEKKHVRASKPLLAKQSSRTTFLVDLFRRPTVKLA